MTAALSAPRHAGSREQARDLLAGLPLDLDGAIVLVDCSDVQLSTPSFFDELVKGVLIDRRGGKLPINGLDARGQRHVSRSAQNRQVESQLSVSAGLA